MSTWLTLEQIPAPQQANFPTLADFILAYTVHSDILNFATNFLSATPQAQYANPQAYVSGIVQDAINLPKFSAIFSAPNPVASGVAAAMNGISLLAQLPVNAGDPNTVSVLTAWENGTGQLYGGHAPITASGGTAATGQSAAPAGSIL
jgi:hypothetical protein